MKSGLIIFSGLLLMMHVFRLIFRITYKGETHYHPMTDIIFAIFYLIGLLTVIFVEPMKEL